MTTYRKKLIEVALPLDAINRGCEEDKNRKTGHIRNLHKWFAPMPLPAWRAMLFASIIDDPATSLDDSAAADAERQRLFRLIERISRFDGYKDAAALSEARAAITAASADGLPTVVDPFCGGGSTLLEAQRLGLPTVGSDLNPVPVLITTVLCRVVPLFAGRPPVAAASPQGHLETRVGSEGFKADVQHYANVIRARAWKRLKEYYPNEGSGVPFSYRWAWTVASPNPVAQGTHTPLVSDWWLSRHKSHRAWVEPVVGRDGITFLIQSLGEPGPGTTGRSGAQCLLTNSPIDLEYIRDQGKAGRLEHLMFAIGTRSERGVAYIVPEHAQVAAAAAVPECDWPSIEMPQAALGFRVQQYGITDFRNLFTRRQAYALHVFSEEIASVHADIRAAAELAGLNDDDASLEGGGTGARAYADAVSAVLALCLGKMAQSNCILVRWFIDPRNGSGKATPAFDRHAVPMVWDFVETNPFGGSVGDWTGPVLETALRAVDLCVPDGIPSVIRQGDARTAHTRLSGPNLIATDPPYYANIGYADLSDFFYLWIRHAIRAAFPSTLSTLATPKDSELIASPHRQGTVTNANAYFRSGFADVFGALASRADPRLPILIVYAIKQSEEADGTATGWEVFLGGLIDAGLSIVATWPVRTTTNTRMIGLGNNALASAVFVIGRPRPATAPVASKRDFIAALQAELPPALARLQKANIAPVDLAQAAIGPGMSVFTRYGSVIDSDGELVTVKEALSLINRALDEALAHQESDFDQDTGWALTWFDQFGFAEGDFGTADSLSRAKNTSIDGMVSAGIIVSRGGKVRLLAPHELPPAWSPGNDQRLDIWEMLHHLIRVLEQEGEAAAAQLASHYGTKRDLVRELAYRLYATCERKKRAKEASSYNGLVHSWPEIVRLAQGAPVRQEQQPLFDQE